MTKQIQNIFTLEKWIPIIVLVIIQIVSLTYYFSQLKEGQDLLSQKIGSIRIAGISTIS